jgi:hypothetical protein
VRHPRLATLALLLGGALIALSACEPVGPPGNEIAFGPPAVESHTVAVLGDSISAMSKGPLEHAGRTRGFATVVDATSGIMTREKQPNAEAFAPTHPDAVVIALGTNDAFCTLENALAHGSCRYPTFSNTDIAVDLGHMADTLHQPATCVLAVNTYASTVVSTADQNLAAADRIDGVIDWRDQAVAHPEYLADQLGHLTLVGQTAYADFVMDGVAKTCHL